MAVNPETVAASEADVQREVQADAPMAEIGTSGPDVAACVRDAISSLGLGCNPAMNAGKNKSLARSERFWDALEPVKRELRQRVDVTLGGDDEASEPALGLRDGYCESRLLRQSLFIRMTESGGPVTNKGRTRALYTAWCAALDREQRLAMTLGLTRKAKRIDTVADLVERG